MRNKEPTALCFVPVRMSSLPWVKQQRKVRKVNSKNCASHLSKSSFHDAHGLSYFLSDGGGKKKPSIFNTCCCPKATLDTHKYWGVESSGWPTVQCEFMPNKYFPIWLWVIFTACNTGIFISPVWRLADGLHDPSISIEHRSRDHS